MNNEGSRVRFDQDFVSTSKPGIYRFNVIPKYHVCRFFLRIGSYPIHLFFLQSSKEPAGANNIVWMIPSNYCHTTPRTNLSKFKFLKLFTVVIEDFWTHTRIITSLQSVVRPGSWRFGKLCLSPWNICDDKWQVLCRFILMHSSRIIKLCRFILMRSSRIIKFCDLTCFIAGTCLALETLLPSAILPFTFVVAAALAFIMQVHTPWGTICMSATWSC